MGNKISNDKLTAWDNSVFKQPPPAPFKLIVAGGREYDNYAELERLLDKMLVNKIKTHEIMIIEGGAKGADALGRQYAMNRGYMWDTMKADWKDFSVTPCRIKTNKYGDYNALAGMNRNQKMADKADALFLAWNGVSTGSRDMMIRAESKGIPIKIWLYPEQKFIKQHSLTEGGKLNARN